MKKLLILQANPIQQSHERVHEEVNGVEDLLFEMKHNPVIRYKLLDLNPVI